MKQSALDRIERSQFLELARDGMKVAEWIGVIVTVMMLPLAALVMIFWAWYVAAVMFGLPAPPT